MENGSTRSVMLMQEPTECEVEDTRERARGSLHLHECRVRLEELMLACYQRATERNLLSSLPAPFSVFTQIVFLHFAKSSEIRTIVKLRIRLHHP